MRETLIAVALLAGLAGSWSPCGLSMVETLEHARGGIVTFAAGARANVSRSSAKDATSMTSAIAVAPA